MAGPYDFIANNPGGDPNIAGAAMQGLAQGQAFSNAQQDRADARADRVFEYQQKLAALQQQVARTRAYGAAVKNIGMKERASAQDYADLMLQFPERAAPIKQAFDVMDKGQRESLLRESGMIYSALRSDRPDIAAAKLKDMSAAYENSGDQQQGKFFADMAKLTEINPRTAEMSVGHILAAAMGPDHFASTFSTLGKESRASDQASADLRTKEAGARAAEAEADIKSTKAQFAAKAEKLNLGKTKAEINNIYSQIRTRAAQLGLDARALEEKALDRLQKLHLETTNKPLGSELTTDGRKALNQTAVDAEVAENVGHSMDDLAEEFARTVQAGGAAASWIETAKRLMGKEDAVTLLRKQVSEVRMTEAIKLLPKGPASDKDIELALKPFPEETANPEFVASFLRGKAKIARLQAKALHAKTDWINAVGHLGRAPTEIDIRGVKVKAGSRFTDVLAELAGRAGDAPSAGVPEAARRLPTETMDY